MQNILNTFNPTEVFSSISNFVGSGYIFLLIVAILAWGIMKKIFKLIIFGVICFVVWSVLVSGVVSF